MCHAHTRLGTCDLGHTALAASTLGPLRVWLLVLNWRRRWPWRKIAPAKDLLCWGHWGCQEDLERCGALGIHLEVSFPGWVHAAAACWGWMGPA